MATDPPIAALSSEGVRPVGVTAPVLASPRAVPASAAAGISASRRSEACALAGAAALLLWPAVWNGYPIVFADSGTYLSQAIHHYAGWDRPIFYSVFMLPLHAGITVWPVIIVQALLTAYVLRLVCRVLLPTLPVGIFVTGVAALSATTWLAFLVCELMPDLFTPLLVLLLAVLAADPGKLVVRERWLLCLLATGMITTQQSSVAVSCVLVAALTVAAWWRGAPDLRRLVWLVLPPALAVVGLCSVNLAAHGRFAVSPFGNVFLLARVIYDGPGMAVLRQDCPVQQWRLCPFLDRFPATSDGFLWQPDSPLTLAGGAKAVSADAGAIILAALRADPLGEARAALTNTLQQLRRFASGDGLQAWPKQVTPWIERDFPPREQAAYAAARQQTGALGIPAGLIAVHRLTGLLGVIVCAVLLPAALLTRSRSAVLLLAVLLALPVSAAITGGLSGPHDRYQSRLMWLPPFAAALAVGSLAAGFRSAGWPRSHRA